MIQTAPPTDPLLQKFHMEGLFLPDEQYDSYLGVPIRYGPKVVDDLIIIDRTSTTLIVAWNQVADGRGNPSSYAIRYREGSISEFTWGEASETEITTAGRSAQITGLMPETKYGVMLVPYWGDRDYGLDFGYFSNVVLASTLAP